MKIDGRRVMRTIVKIKDDGLEVAFMGQSARGTPVMLGVVKTTRENLKATLDAAPETLRRQAPPPVS